MKRGFLVVLLSVLLSGLTAYGVVKATNTGGILNQQAVESGSTVE